MDVQTSIRPLRAADHDAVFAMMADPVAITMAAFTPEDPEDRAAFDRHRDRIAAIPGVRNWAVLDDADHLVGTIATFPEQQDLMEVAYWIDRAHWGRGHASRALALVLAETARPVRARVATDNLASLRVLAKAGFLVVGQDRGYANGRRAETDEFVLRLD